MASIATDLLLATWMSICFGFRIWMEWNREMSLMQWTDAPESCNHFADFLLCLEDFLVEPAKANTKSLPLTCPRCEMLSTFQIFDFSIDSKSQDWQLGHALYVSLAAASNNAQSALHRTNPWCSCDSRRCIDTYRFNSEYQMRTVRWSIHGGNWLRRERLLH